MKFLKPLLGLFSISALTLSVAQASMPKSQVLLADLKYSLWPASYYCERQ